MIEHIACKDCGKDMFLEDYDDVVWTSPYEYIVWWNAECKHCGRRTVVKCTYKISEVSRE